MSEIFDLSAEALASVCAVDPLFATEEGISGHDHEWTDLSPDGHAAQRDLWSSMRGRAARCQVLDDSDELAQRVLIDEAEARVSFIDSDWHLRDLNNLTSPWQNIRTVFHNMPMQRRDDWAAIISRLDTIDDAMSGYQQSLSEGVRTGQVPARRQVSAAVEQGHHAIGDDSSFNSLLGEFDQAAAVDPAIAELRTHVQAGITKAKRVYADATAWLTEQIGPHAPERDGVGIDRYLASANYFLGDTLDPYETYDWGWTEVHRIRVDLEQACARVRPDASVADVIDLLTNDPERSCHSVDEFLDVMQQRQEQALADLEGRHLDVDSRIRQIEVLAAPAGGATAPYYTAPSDDFARPGRVWYPVDGRTSFPLYGEISTAYHEGFPGHHLQVGTQVAMGDELSRFHKKGVWYPGSGEGWALYAERLMGELGYLDSIDYEIGLLVSQLFRACRVVVDIGCHLGLPIPASSPVGAGLDWSFDLAVEMMRDVAHLPPANAVSEVVRYLGWPGQAITYKVGEQAIVDLRDEWDRANGSDDRKRFHREVLSIGSIGLDLTRDLVRAAM